MSKVKFLSIIIVAIMLFGFVACNGNDADVDTPDTPKEPEILEDNELLNKLTSSMYSDYITGKNEWGLSDVSSVGVDYDHSREVYDVLPADSSFQERIYKAEDYGISVTNASNTSALNALMNQLKEVEGLKKIEFREGVYKFSGYIKMQNLSDVYLVGSGTDFVYTNWTNAFKIYDCKNVHFSGITFDYSPSATVSGTIKSCDTANKKIVISLYDEFDLSDSRYKNGKITYGNYMEYVPDEATGSLIPDANGNLKYNSTGDSVTSITDGSYNKQANELTLTFTSIKEAEVGKAVSVSFTMYEYHTVYAEDCEELYFENVDFYSTCGMMLTTISCKNVYLNDTNMKLKEGSKRLQTATADGLHGIDCYGDMLVRNCLFENSHDDAINVCSFYKTVTSAQAKTLTCTSASLDTDFPVSKGDVIEIYNPADFSLYGEYTVENVNVSMLTYTITLNKMIKENIEGYLVGNVTRTPSLVIENCIFRNKRNRGVLAQVRNSRITNCAFVNIIHGAISVHTVQDIFSEAIMPRNIEITNNKFLSNNEGYGLAGDVDVFVYGKSGVASGVLKNVSVKNNLFFNGCQAGIRFQGAGDCTVSDNLFVDPNRKYSSDSYNTILLLVYCDSITVEGNTVYMDERDGFELQKGKENKGITINNNVIKLKQEENK